LLIPAIIFEFDGLCFLAAWFTGWSCIIANNGLYQVHF
jgi:hypothetical protein